MLQPFLKHLHLIIALLFHLKFKSHEIKSFILDYSLKLCSTINKLTRVSWLYRIFNTIDLLWHVTTYMLLQAPLPVVDCSTLSICWDLMLLVNTNYLGMLFTYLWNFFWNFCKILYMLEFKENESITFRLKYLSTIAWSYTQKEKIPIKKWNTQCHHHSSSNGVCPIHPQQFQHPFLCTHMYFTWYEGGIYVYQHVQKMQYQKL